jgi:hypothetical protein
MDKFDKELLVLFEESKYAPNLENIKNIIKTNKLFKKLIKLCIQFRIKIYDMIDDRYIVRSKEKIIKNCYQKRSDIIEKLAKSINNYNQLEKVVLNRKVKILLNQDSDKKTDSSLPDDTFDIKAGIDKLYLEFKNESKILESLIDLLINHFSIELLQQYYSESENVKSNTNKFIEEYINR